MNNKHILFFVMGVALFACTTVNNLFATETPKPTETPVPTNTPMPTATSTPEPTATLPPTNTPRPTSLSVTFELGERQEVEGASYSYQPIVGYGSTVRPGQVTQFIESDEFSFVMTIAERPTIPGEDASEALSGLLEAMPFNLGIINLAYGDFYPYTVGSVEGVAVDITGILFGSDAVGRAIVVATEYDRIFFASAFGVVTTQNDYWQEEGDAAFIALLDSVEFAEPSAEIPACLISDDPTYGYAEENPIRVGGDAFIGPSRERAYLDNLLGPNGEAVSYVRTSSLVTEDTILDIYSVEIQGVKTVTLYLDEYHYIGLQAPVGFTCIGPFILGP